ncbi:MAG: hypothetical protein EXR21_10190 [Flavobacteriaceae bacterium]|nr:hypothetical protein [Flavobacteriaceae bacterium]
MRDYYKILNVPYSSTLTEIKKSYRKLAFQFHPDKNSDTDAAKNFIEITEAYEVLRDDQKRTDYDFYYRKHFKENQKTYNSDDNFIKKQAEWSSEGKSKANEYSSMPYEEFASRVFEEIKIGVKYIPNILLILIIGMFAVFCIAKIPKHGSAVDGTMGPYLLFLGISGAIGVYFLFNKAKSKYLDDRNNRFNNK